MQRLGEIGAFKDRNLILKGADIATQRGWTGVPNIILESNRISVGAKLVYTMLLKYAREMDECFPGQERLSKDMGSGKRSVVRYISELESAGLITIHRRGLFRIHCATCAGIMHRGHGRPNLHNLPESVLLEKREANNMQRMLIREQRNSSYKKLTLQITMLR